MSLNFDFSYSISYQPILNLQSLTCTNIPTYTFIKLSSSMKVICLSALLCAVGSLPAYKEDGTLDKSSVFTNEAYTDDELSGQVIFIYLPLLCCQPNMLCIVDSIKRNPWRCDVSQAATRARDTGVLHLQGFHRQKPRAVLPSLPLR